MNTVSRRKGYTPFKYIRFYYTALLPGALVEHFVAWLPGYMSKCSRLLKIIGPKSTVSTIIFICGYNHCYHVRHFEYQKNFYIMQIFSKSVKLHTSHVIGK